MFTYRQLDDPREILPIATSAFALRRPEQEAIDPWLSQSIRHERKLFGVYEESRLLAGFMLYDFHMRLRSSVVPMGGIGLLCSRLDTRGRGAVRTMLTNSLETMKEHGHIVSVLDPFDETFYRKYGWEKFSQFRILDTAPGNLVIPEDVDTSIIATDLPFPDRECREYYNTYAADHYTLAQRSTREWERRTKILAWSTDTAARGVVRFDSEHQISGLMGYDLTRKQGDHLSTFNVNLLIYENAGVLREMLRYLKRLSHQVSTVRMTLPMDCDLWPYLAHRPDKSAIRDLFMIRIISIEALDGLRMDGPNMSVSVDVIDDQAKWNQGVWELAVDDGILRVRRGTHADLRCGIGALSSVIAGFSDFRELISALKATPLETYQGQDFPKVTTFLADYF